MAGERFDPSIDSLRQAFSVQRRVIWALLMREILTRYGRHNIGFLWLFVEPMIFTLGVTALWTATQSVHGSDLPIVAFAVTGYSTVLQWRNMPSRCILSATFNNAVLYHRMIKVIDIYIARILLEFIGATMSFVFLAAFFTFIGWMEPPEDVLKVFTGWVMVGLFGASLAVFLASLSERFEIIERLWHPASYLIFPLSGAAFLVASLPPEAQNFVLYIPMVHGSELLREGYFGSHINAIYDVGYLALCTMVMLCIGLAMSRNVRDYVVPE
ncbi:MAG TPA: ABC transporter permease [Sphingomicrobium sp.]|nr:ABC transporter permease [Sphingomicrobium sp.]